MSKQTVELQYITNAKMILGELRLVNAELHNIRLNTEKTGKSHSLAAAGANKQSSAMKGLALRFVGYNLVLNQVMGAQQKLVQFVQESVKAYREFETRMAEINTILGSEQLPILGRLKSGIENLSVAYGQATSDMSKGMYDILSAAFAAEDALNLLTTATKASIAGLSEIRVSVDIFTTVLNTYGMQVEQATSVSNTLFQSVIRGKFQFQDLEQALGYVVPIAAQAGIVFSELMAALSTATRHGLHLDMTSRGLALAIQGIVNPSVKATKAAEKYGIEMNGLALRVMGLHGWFEKLNEATKEYGTSILGELIPNMRSLRVAMVLASDVGLAGFNQDLIELANMGNATEMALNKIMNTSQFVANQLSQQWEQTKREIGDDWDALFLGIQKGFIDIVNYMRTSGKPEFAGVGKDYEFVSDDAIHNATEYIRISERILNLETERDELPPDSPDPGLLESFLRMLGSPFLSKGTSAPVKDLNDDIAELIETQAQFTDSFNDVVGGILTEIDALGDLELTLDTVELAIRDLEEELTNTFVYGFQDSAGAMKEASISISELTTLTQEQRDALSQLGTTIQGNLAYQYLALEAQRTYADATHDVSSGLQIANYAYKEIPQNIQEAVNAVRDYTKAQDENRAATQRMTAAMRVYQIQLLELQLKGMMRRRGLTRSEEKQIKVIQIAQAKARLENMQSQQSVLETDVSTYQAKQQLIDDYLFGIKETQYELKYIYDQQIANLEETISREGEKLQTRYEWWELTNQKIIDDSQSLIDTLDSLMEEPIFLEMLDRYGLKVDELKIKIAELMNVAIGQASTYAESPIPKYYDVPGYGQAIGTPADIAAKYGVNISDLIPHYERGIEYVPETGIAVVHKGETITPAGEAASSGIRIDNVTIQVKEIADIDDVEKLSAMLSQAESSGLMTRGKTNYKLRMG